MTGGFDAIVLAGSSSRRLGGADKPLLMVGGQTLLSRACESAVRSGADRVLVVGPERADLPERCAWVADEVVGAGPAAAAAAGVRALGDGGSGDTRRLVLVMAADLPRVEPVIAPLVAAAAGAVADGRDGAIARAEGRDQYLLLSATLAALRRVVGDGDLAGWPMGRLVEGLDLVRVDVPADPMLDTDTWEAVAQSRADVGGTMTMLDDWADRARVIAGVEGAPIDVDAILELARDAAHGVERPAAPVSTFILGYAAAARGLDAAGIASLAAELGREALAE